MLVLDYSAIGIPTGQSLKGMFQSISDPVGMNLKSIVCHL